MSQSEINWMKENRYNPDLIAQHIMNDPERYVQVLKVMLSTPGDDDILARDLHAAIHALKYATEILGLGYFLDYLPHAIRILNHNDLSISVFKRAAQQLVLDPSVSAETAWLCIRPVLRQGLFHREALQEIDSLNKIRQIKMSQGNHMGYPELYYPDPDQGYVPVSFGSVNYHSIRPQSIPRESLSLIRYPLPKTRSAKPYSKRSSPRSPRSVQRGIEEFERQTYNRLYDDEQKYLKQPSRRMSDPYWGYGVFKRQGSNIPNRSRSRSRK